MLSFNVLGALAFALYARDPATAAPSTCLPQQAALQAHTLTHASSLSCSWTAGAHEDGWVLQSAEPTLVSLEALLPPTRARKSSSNSTRRSGRASTLRTP